MICSQRSAEYIEYIQKEEIKKMCTVFQRPIMREALYQTGIGLYILWIIATTLLILGRYTPFPSYKLVHSAVVTGAVALTIVGTGQLLRKGYRKVVSG
jgi:hypothetical protein